MQRFGYLLTLGLFCAMSPVLAASYSGTVTSVKDGDTIQFTTDQGERFEVRLTGIDAPEKASKERKPQRYAEQSRDMLNRLALERRAVLEAMKTERTGRRVGILTVETDNGNVDAGLVQLQMGLARTFAPHLAELPDSLRESYKYAEGIARIKRRGLWADEKTVARSTGKK